MGKNIKELLTEALGDIDSESNGNDLKTTLAAYLYNGDKEVMDSAWDDNTKERTRKDRRDECRAQDPSKCWKHGFAADIVKGDMKTRARKMARINPAPTSDIERELDIERDLREIEWDLDDPPDTKLETENMVRDLDTLRKEAGMKKLDESFPPFAAYRQKWKEYENFKKESRQMLKTAETAMERHRYDMAETILTSLKDRPDAINGKYKEVLAAYDAVNDALCDLLDSQGNSRGAKDPNALSAEKNGYGMMEGENSKDYQKRMKSIGKGKDIPETVKKIDNIVAQTERRWRSVAGISKDEFETVKKNFRKSFSNLMKRCSLASNVSIAGLNGILEGHLKTQHDLTPKGKRYDDGNFSHNAIIGGNEDMPRYKFTRKCFGTDRGMDESKYEKYGCLHLLNPSKEDNSMGGQYGKNVIRWKPHKAVATMTFSDSLCLSRDGLNYVNPCLVTDPSPCCFNPENQDMVETLREKPVNIGLDSMCDWAGTPYIELQLHGEDQYDAEAIESISFGSVADVKNLSKAAVQKILDNNIEIYVGDRKIDLSKR